MPTLNELLADKARRLESIPDRFATEVQQVQKDLIGLIEDILGRFDVDSNGFLIISKRNLELAGDVDLLLREALSLTEYDEAVTAFAKEFNNQIAFNDDYFKQAFPEFTRSELGQIVVRQSQANAVQLLVNTTPDSELILPLKEQIEQAVINGARYRDTLDAIRLVVLGDEEKEGALLRYTKQIAHDTFAVADRSYASAVAEEMGAEWFKYQGGEIKTTRPFCAERHGRHFHKKEIEAWGDGVRTLGFAWPQSGEWDGEMEGTNARTIFSTAGGYNCQHSIMAVSIFQVPEDDLQRALTQGYWKPSEAEMELLGM